MPLRDLYFLKHMPPEYRTALNDFRRRYPTVCMRFPLQNDSSAHGAFFDGTGEIFRGRTANWQYVPSNVP